MEIKVNSVGGKLEIVLRCADGMDVGVGMGGWD